MAALSRREELATALQAVESRITRACAAAGRSRGEITLVAVSKTWPAGDVGLLAELGVHDIAENRDQEARRKVAALTGLPLRWHFVGRLQTNKCRSVASYAAVVHSVDRLRLVGALADGAGRAGRRLDVLIQVALAERRTDRGGAAATDVPALAEAVAGADGLRLAGVMAVAPAPGPGVPPPAESFARLAAVAAQLHRDYPDASWVSAGMTEDLEPAIAAGATHVRVGTALFGNRPAPTGNVGAGSTDQPPGATR